MHGSTKALAIALLATSAWAHAAAPAQAKNTAPVAPAAPAAPAIDVRAAFRAAQQREGSYAAYRAPAWESRVYPRKP